MCRRQSKCRRQSRLEYFADKFNLEKETSSKCSRHCMVCRFGCWKYRFWKLSSQHGSISHRQWPSFRLFCCRTFWSPEVRIEDSRHHLRPIVFHLIASIYCKFQASFTMSSLNRPVLGLRPTSMDIPDRYVATLIQQSMVNWSIRLFISHWFRSHSCRTESTDST